MNAIETTAMAPTGAVAMDRSGWAQAIGGAWRKSVEAIFETGRLIADAKAALPHGEFGKMIEAELPFGASTAQRLMMIAADPKLSDPAHVQHLPPSWGTLYELTKLDEDTFKRRVTEGAIRPDMQRRDVSTGGARSIMASREQPAESLDFFPTPPWATRSLVEVVLPHLGVSLDGMTAHDPACGEGHMTGVLLEYEKIGAVVGSDIKDYGRDGRTAPAFQCTDDFLNPSAGIDPDWIITNPPFGDKTLQFVLRALEVAGTGVAMFVRQQWLEGVDRYEQLFRDRPPTLYAQFVERVNLCEGKWDPYGSTATAYCWLVWVKDRTPQAPFWIPPGMRKRFLYADDIERFTAHPVLPPVGDDLPGQDDFEGLVDAYRSAIELHHCSILDGDSAEAVAENAGLMRRVLERANGDTHFGVSVNELPCAVVASCRAAPGEVPMFGQAGCFLCEADGVTAWIVLDQRCDGAKVHAAALNEKFPSNTGYHCVLGIRPEPGMAVYEFGQKAIRHSIAYANDQKVQGWKRGLLYPERAYRLATDTYNDHAIEGYRWLEWIERGEEIERDSAPEWIEMDWLNDQAMQWSAARGTNSKAFPQMHHPATPIFAIDGSTLTPVADFPVDQGYLWRPQGGTAWRMAGDRDRRNDEIPATVTAEEFAEYKAMAAIASDVGVAGPLIDRLRKDGLVWPDDLVLTPAGHQRAQYLHELVQAATSDGDGDAVRVEKTEWQPPDTAQIGDAIYHWSVETNGYQPDVPFAWTPISERLLRLGFMARVPGEEIAKVLGTSRGAVMGKANRLGLTDKSRAGERTDLKAGAQ